jgi:hypothetical protein
MKATLLNHEITPLPLSLSLSNTKKRGLLSMWLTIKSGKGFANDQMADFSRAHDRLRIFPEHVPIKSGKGCAATCSGERPYGG